MRETLIHATCVAPAPGEAAATAEPAFAVLLRGPPGAGKSDLALRLIDQGWRLVADDQTAIERAGEALLASAPGAIAGLLEVRGLGILTLPALARARLCLVADLVAAGKVERLPAAAHCELLGVTLPRLDLAPFEASAPAKLRLAAGRAAAAIMAGRRQEEASRSGAQRGENNGVTDQTESAGSREPEAGASGRGPAAGRGRRVVLVTGLSGAGRTASLDILEDLGYEAIDNPPLDLLESIVRSEAAQSIAVGVDIRTRAFSVEPFLGQLERLAEDPELAVMLLFIDCDDEVLRQRYSETRRRHPLAEGRPLADGITAERRLVSPLRDRADLVVDTTGLRLADLRRLLSGHLGFEESAGMAVFVTSFAYRQGLPRAADLVFDVRFLDNPHYEASLRELTGRDPEVAAFVAADPGLEPFITGLTGMLGPLLPRYQREGKSYLTLALGCTGGRHRSVLVAERLAAWLRDKGYPVTLVHRDLPAGQDLDRT